MLRTQTQRPDSSRKPYDRNEIKKRSNEHVRRELAEGAAGPLDRQLNPSAIGIWNSSTNGLDRKRDSYAEVDSQNVGMGLYGTRIESSAQMEIQSNQSSSFFPSSSNFKVADSHFNSYRDHLSTANYFINVNSGSGAIDNDTVSIHLPTRPAVDKREVPLVEIKSSQKPSMQLRKSSEIYYRHLLTLGHGSPLWIPEPSNTLPIEYQMAGIAIGDVGILKDSGGFDFLFNLYQPHNDPKHPINPREMPPGFWPLDPPDKRDVDSHTVFRSWSCLTSSHVHSHQDGSPGFVFESSAEDGAILTMPNGANSMDLDNMAVIRKYVSMNVNQWYMYANDVRGRNARNGDLRIVIGKTSATTWGMATFTNESNAAGPAFRLKFTSMPKTNGEDGKGASSSRYMWEYSGQAEVKSGPDEREVERLRELHRRSGEEDRIEYENQCLFVRTINVTLGEVLYSSNDSDVSKQFADIGRNHCKPQHVEFSVQQNLNEINSKSARGETRDPRRSQTHHIAPGHHHLSPIKYDRDLLDIGMDDEVNDEILESDGILVNNGANEETPNSSIFYDDSKHSRRRYQTDTPQPYSRIDSTSEATFHATSANASDCSSVSRRNGPRNVSRDKDRDPSHYLLKSSSLIDTGFTGTGTTGSFATHIHDYVKTPSPTPSQTIPTIYSPLSFQSRLPSLHAIGKEIDKADQTYGSSSRVLPRLPHLVTDLLADESRSQSRPKSTRIYYTANPYTPTESETGSAFHIPHQRPRIPRLMPSGHRRLRSQQIVLPQPPPHTTEKANGESGGHGINNRGSGLTQEELYDNGPDSPRRGPDHNKADYREGARSLDSTFPPVNVPPNASQHSHFEFSSDPQAHSSRSSLSSDRQMHYPKSICIFEGPFFPDSQSAETDECADHTHGYGRPNRSSELPIDASSQPEPRAASPPSPWESNIVPAWPSQVTSDLPEAPGLHTQSLAGPSSIYSTEGQPASTNHTHSAPSRRPARWPGRRRHARSNDLGSRSISFETSQAQGSGRPTLSEPSVPPGWTSDPRLHPTTTASLTQDYIHGRPSVSDTNTLPGLVPFNDRDTSLYDQSLDSLKGLTRMVSTYHRGAAASGPDGKLTRPESPWWFSSSSTQSHTTETINESRDHPLLGVAPSPQFQPLSLSHGQTSSHKRRHEVHPVQHLLAESRIPNRSRKALSAPALRLQPQNLIQPLSNLSSSSGSSTPPGRQVDGEVVLARSPPTLRGARPLKRRKVVNRSGIVDHKDTGRPSRSPAVTSGLIWSANDPLPSDTSTQPSHRPAFSPSLSAGRNNVLAYHDDDQRGVAPPSQVTDLIQPTQPSPNSLNFQSHTTEMANGSGEPPEYNTHLGAAPLYTDFIASGGYSTSERRVTWVATSGQLDATQMAGESRRPSRSPSLTDSDADFARDGRPLNGDLHPSRVINEFLLRSVPGATMAISEDRDWISVLQPSDQVFPSDDVLLSRINEMYEVCVEEGVAFLQRRQQSD